MASKPPPVPLDSGLDLRQVVTTGSIIQINEEYDDLEYYPDSKPEPKHIVDSLGKPVANFMELEKTMFPVDYEGFVMKKIIEKGGGLPLCDVCTVSVAFSGYWENDLEPFDSRKLHNPLVVDLKDNGLLPGLQLAIRSMLVGETSLFLFSHVVMYGEMGIPPRIRPSSSCAFYIKLIKSIFTPQEKVDFSMPNMFNRVINETKMLYSSGGTLYRTNNISGAIQMFRKGVSIMHKCRLANENEQKIQEKLLYKLYLNLAICYNRTKQPLKACTACNELNRLDCLWPNSKALFQNAKALRMIGEFDIAEKRLQRAIMLHSRKRYVDPRHEADIISEMEALQKARKSCNQTKLVYKVSQARLNLVTDDFKREVNHLIKNFKANPDLCKLIMPSGLNSAEVAYINEICIKENLFFNKVRKDYSLEDEENVTNVKAFLNPEVNYALGKYRDGFAVEDESSQCNEHQNKEGNGDGEDDGEDNDEEEDCERDNGEDEESEEEIEDSELVNDETEEYEGQDENDEYKQNSADEENQEQDKDDRENETKNEYYVVKV